MLWCRMRWEDKNDPCTGRNGEAKKNLKTSIKTIMINRSNSGTNILQQTPWMPTKNDSSSPRQAQKSSPRTSGNDDGQVESSV